MSNITHPYWLITFNHSLVERGDQAIIRRIDYISSDEWKQHYNSDWDGEQEDYVLRESTDEAFLLVGPLAKYKYHSSAYDFDYYFEDDLSIFSHYRINGNNYSSHFHYTDSDNPVRGHFENDARERFKANCMSVQTSCVDVIRKMNNMHKEIGEKWKLPDFRGCLLYALTEANEYLESILLAIRSGDSRNNKATDAFETQTEMFDISMMLLRSLMDVYGANDKAIEYFNLAITRYMSKVRAEGVKSDISHPDNRGTAKLQALYESEGAYAVKLISDFIAKIDERLRSSDSVFWEDEYCDLFAEYAMPLLDFIVNHPFMGPINIQYLNASNKKLDKILNKNMAKKE